MSVFTIFNRMSLFVSLCFISIALKFINKTVGQRPQTNGFCNGDLEIARPGHNSTWFFVPLLFILFYGVIWSADKENRKAVLAGNYLELVSKGWPEKV